ncbi:MAG TPA: nitroreductase/quinone reductase family protein [Ktedonobacterales bacterium]
MAEKQTNITYFHVIANMLTGQRAFRGDERSQAGFLTLTTTGRKTGQQRMTHLVYMRDGADYVLTASNGGGPRDPGWLYNIRSNPQVMIGVHGKTLRGTAEVAGPEKRKALWEQWAQIAPMYKGYEKRTTREIQMVIVHPTPASDR